MVEWHLCSAAWVIMDTAVSHVSCVCVCARARVCVCFPLLLCSKAVTLMSDRYLFALLLLLSQSRQLQFSDERSRKRAHAKTSPVFSLLCLSLSLAPPLLLLCFTALKWPNDDTEHCGMFGRIVGWFLLPLLWWTLVYVGHLIVILCMNVCRK